MATPSIRGAGAYPENLVPAVRPGDYVRLLPDDDIRRIVSFTPQPGIRVLNSEEGDDVTVGANDNEKVELDRLKHEDNELAQLRLVSPGTDLPDGVEVEVDYGGRQAPYYTSKNARARIDNNSATVSGYDEGAGSAFVSDGLQSQLLEYYVFEQEAPYFDLYNTTGADITVSDITFAGYRFDVTPEPETQAPSSMMAVPIQTERFNR